MQLVLAASRVMKALPLQVIGLIGALATGSLLAVAQGIPGSAKDHPTRQRTSASASKRARQANRNSAAGRLNSRAPAVNRATAPPDLAADNTVAQPAEPRLQIQLGHARGVSCVGWRYDGRTLASGAGDGVVKLWDCESARLINTLAGKIRSIDSLSWSPDGKLLAVAGLVGVDLWDAGRGRLFKTFEVKGPGMSSVAWSPDGTKLACACSGRITIWNVKEGRTLSTFAGDRPIAWRPDGKTLAGSDAGGQNVLLWDTGSGGLKTSLKTDSAITSIAWSPDGSTLGWGSLDRRARLWQVEGGQTVTVLEGQSKMIHSVTWSPNGELLAAASGDVIGEQEHEPIRVWDTRTSKTHTIFNEAPSTSWCVAWSPDVRYLASGDDDSVVRLWDATTGQLHASLTGSSESPWAVRWSPDGHTLAVEGVGNFVDSSHTGNAVRLWDLQNGQLRSSFTGAFDWSPDGKLLATSSPDENTVKLWVADKAEMRATLPGHAGPVPFLTFSPDGITLASWSRDHDVRLWDTKDGHLLAHVSGEFSSTKAVTWSPDGTSFVSAGNNNVRELRDTRTGRARATLSSATAVAWSPDGASLATGNLDGSVHLLDGRSGTLRANFRGRAEEISFLAWSPDGRTIVSVGGGRRGYGVMRLWDVHTRRLRCTITALSNPISVTWTLGSKFFVVEDAVGGVDLRDGKTGKVYKEIRADHANIYELTWLPKSNIVAVPDEGNTMGLWDLGSGRLLSTVESDSRIVTAAFSPDGKLLTSCTLSGACTLWRISPWAAGARSAEDTSARADTSALARRICTLVILGDDLAVVMPDGRFDTNNLELTRSLYWIIPDEPFRTLPLEIFMRQFYEPRLLRRIFKGEKLPVPPRLAGLNRVQPKIGKPTILTRPGHPEMVDVKVEVSSVAGQCLKNGERVPCESGVYDLRLYRDGQLVKRSPLSTADAIDSSPQDPEEQRRRWQETSVVKTSDGHPVTLATGPKEITFTDIRLPQRSEVSRVEFTAYAFNEARVKSVTSEPTVHLLPPDRQSGLRRAYVISVGVDFTSDPSTRLSFAPTSAREIDRWLQETLRPQYDVEPVRLISEYHEDGVAGADAPATKENIQTVLSLLSAGGGTAAQRLSFPTLQPATPDDLVVLYIASHGYANPQGTFYVIPSDIGEPAGVSEQLLDRCLTRLEQSDICVATRQFLHHSISSNELTDWLHMIDAGEMVLILDSCHSGAVSGPNFKPGPMGDRGFGQLSYDKGMLVLAATQAENVAWGTLALGDKSLLIQALTQQAGAAERFDFKQWLSQAEKQVPELYTRFVGQRTPTTEGQPQQEPALFDFRRGRIAAAKK